MGSHLVNGTFQSDKYKMVPAGKVPLSVKDPAAQDLLWEYAQRRRFGSHGSKETDAEFSDDLEAALKNAGFVPPAMASSRVGYPYDETKRAWRVEGRLPGGARAIHFVNAETPEAAQDECARRDAYTCVGVPAEINPRTGQRL